MGAFMFAEASLALLRNPSYCVYAAASQTTARDQSNLEQAFNTASVSERSKFQEETLVNYGGRRTKKSTTYRSHYQDPRAVDELMVVTLLVASQGSVKLPSRIDSLAGLQALLRGLGSLSPSQIMGVELLWTPQASGDYYTKDEIIQDYPHLVSL